jgi:hypothetical protein
MSVTTVWAIPSGTNSPPAEVIDPVIVERFPYSSSSKTTTVQRLSSFCFTSGSQNVIRLDTCIYYVIEYITVVNLIKQCIFQ